jgi:hypothetical protein
MALEAPTTNSNEFIIGLLGREASLTPSIKDKTSPVIKTEEVLVKHEVEIENTNKRTWQLDALNLTGNPNLQYSQLLSTSLQKLQVEQLNTFKHDDQSTIDDNSRKTSLESCNNSSSCSNKIMSNGKPELEQSLLLDDNSHSMTNNALLKNDENSSSLSKSPIHLTYGDLSKLNNLLNVKSHIIPKNLIKAIRLHTKSPDSKTVILAIKLLCKIRMEFGLIKMLLSHRDSNVRLTILEESSRIYRSILKRGNKNKTNGGEEQYLIEIAGYIPDLFLFTKDFNPLIRMAAHSFLFIISEHEITIQERLFRVLCDDVNDGDIRVRVNCCRLMGQFKQVSKELLLQTLSKKELLEKTKVKKLLKLA